MVTYRRNFTNFVNLKCLISTYVFQDIVSQDLNTLYAVLYSVKYSLCEAYKKPSMFFFVPHYIW